MMEPMELGMANGSSLDGSQIDTYNGVYYTLGIVAAPVGQERQLDKSRLRLGCAKTFSEPFD